MQALSGGNRAQREIMSMASVGTREGGGHSTPSSRQSAKFTKGLHVHV